MCLFQLLHVNWHLAKKICSASLRVVINIQRTILLFFFSKVKTIIITEKLVWVGIHVFVYAPFLRCLIIHIPVSSYTNLYYTLNCIWSRELPVLLNGWVMPKGQFFGRLQNSLPQLHLFSVDIQIEVDIKPLIIGIENITNIFLRKPSIDFLGLAVILKRGNV